MIASEIFMRANRTHECIRDYLKSHRSGWRNSDCAKRSDERKRTPHPSRFACHLPLKGKA